MNRIRVLYFIVVPMIKFIFIRVIIQAGLHQSNIFQMQIASNPIIILQANSLTVWLSRTSFQGFHISSSSKLLDISLTAVWYITNFRWKCVYFQSKKILSIVTQGNPTKPPGYLKPNCSMCSIYREINDTTNITLI